MTFVLFGLRCDSLCQQILSPDSCNLVIFVIYGLHLYDSALSPSLYCIVLNYIKDFTVEDFLVSDAVIDSYVVVIMLKIGGAGRLPFSQLSKKPHTEPSVDVFGGLSAATHDQMTSSDNVTELSTTLHQSTITNRSVFHQLQPAPAEDDTTAFIVGPMMYIYFTADNTSDAGFTVDLLFQHHSYADASYRFVSLFCCRTKLNKNNILINEHILSDIFG